MATLSGLNGLALGFDIKDGMDKKPDAHYVNPKLARLYDLDSGWSRERDFYVGLAGQAPKSILDLGCGTGLICDALSELGHDVTGADPAEAMLDIGRAKPHGQNIEWVMTTAQKFRSDKKFDLIIMTGNAFQVLLTDEDLEALFKQIKSHLKPTGLFAFETRNPELDWPSKWNYEMILNTPWGSVAESRRFLSWSDNKMKFELKYKFPDEDLVSMSEIRFWNKDEIEKCVTNCGLYIERVMGDWEFEDLNEVSSKEMVFFIRPQS